MTEEVKKTEAEIEAEKQAALNAEKEKGTESSIKIDKAFVAELKEALAKSGEATKKAEKSAVFHGTKEAKVKFDKAQQIEIGHKFIRDIAKGHDNSTSKIIAQVHADRFKAIRGDTDANGGFLVPTVFETEIEATFDAYSEIIQDADVKSFTRPGRVFNLNELDTRVVIYDGVGEDYDGTASTPTYTEPQIGIRNYIGSTDITEDFMEDEENDAMSNLASQYGEGMAQKLQLNLINNTTTSSGIVASGLFVKGVGATTVTAVATASGYTAVTPVDFENVFYSAIAIDHFQDANKDGKFYYHPLVEKSLRANIRNATNQSDVISVFDPIEAGLLSRPRVMTNQAPTPATTVSDPYVLYANLKRHLKIRRKRGVTMKINTQGTSLGGRNLNYQLGRELVVTQRIGHQLVLKSGMVHLITN